MTFRNWHNRITGRLGREVPRLWAHFASRLEWGNGVPWIKAAQNIRNAIRKR